MQVATATVHRDTKNLTLCISLQLLKFFIKKLFLNVKTITVNIHTSLSQANCTFVLLLLHVSAEIRRHFQEATDVGDMYSALFRLSNLNGKMFIHSV
jgi:hypothetical protein